MSFLSLTFRDLQYLVALADKKHFGHAAKSCFVSQPALSSQIKKIEGYFGKTIFERKNKTIFLTPDGELIVQKAQEFLNTALELEQKMKSNHQLFKFPLKVGIIHTLSPYYPNLFIEKILSQCPESALFFKEGFTDELVEDLKNGKIDVLIASEVFQDEQLGCHPLFKESLSLIVNKKHPFAQKEQIALNELNPDEMVFLQEGNCLRNEVIDLCPKNRRGNIHEYHIKNIEALKMTIALSKVYSIIPNMATDLTKQMEKFVVIKKIKAKEAFRQISIYSRNNTVRKSEIDFLIKILSKVNQEN